MGRTDRTSRTRARNDTTASGPPDEVDGGSTPSEAQTTEYDGGTPSTDAFALTLEGNGPE